MFKSKYFLFHLNHQFFIKDFFENFHYTTKSFPKVIIRIFFNLNLDSISVKCETFGLVPPCSIFFMKPWRLFETCAFKNQTGLKVFGCQGFLIRQGYYHFSCP